MTIVSAAIGACRQFGTCESSVVLFVLSRTVFWDVRAHQTSCRYTSLGSPDGTVLWVDNNPGPEYKKTCYCPV